MPTVAERQALVFLTAVALLGGGVRVWHNRQFEQRLALVENDSAAASHDAKAQLAAVDSVRSTKKGKRSRERPAVPAIIDVDIASSEQLETLPRIGPALAQRIVANRDSLGGFGSLEELGRVRGIGKAMLTTLEPLITFSASPSRARQSSSSATSPRDVSGNSGKIRRPKRRASGKGVPNS
jgi:DNA uptake protein ComE-like DNA-binding protein